LPDKKSLLNSTLIYSLSSITSIFLFLLFIIAARYLGTEDFGKFTFAIAFVFLFDPLIDPGLYHFLIREIARNKDATSRFVSHALTWKLMITPLVFLIIFICVNIIHDSQKTLQAVYIMTIALFLKSYKDAFRPALLAHEYFGLETISIFIERVSILILGSLALIMGQGLLTFCWVFVIVRVLDLIIIAVIVRWKICGITLGFDIGFLKHIVITAVPIGAFYITLNVYNYIDTVMLSILKTDAEVGWYNASYKIYEGLLIIPVIIGTVFMPRLSQLFKNNKEAFNDLILKGLKFIILISVFVIFNGIILSDKIITFCFGIEYNRAIMSLNVLLTGIMFVFTINFLQTAMITMDKQKIVLYLAVLSLIFNIILNLYLIPKYSYIGAALATVIVEFFLFLSLLIYTQKIGIKILWWKLIGKPPSALLISVLIFWVLSPLNIVYLRLFLVNICFITLLFFMRIFDKEELSELYNLRFSLRKSGRK
jgi:O-antigen/teichoic acid export membrane protein